MSDQRYKNRYYVKGKYEAAIGTIATGLVFLFVAILSLVFRAINFDFIGLSAWGYWLFIPAFFIFIGGFTQIYTNNKFQRAIQNALMDRDTNAVLKLEDLSLEVGIKPNDALRVLADLRAKGQISYSFNSETGEIILGEKIEYSRSNNFKTPPKKIEAPLSTNGKNYCVYCGQQLESHAKYCPFCGSKI